MSAPEPAASASSLLTAIEHYAAEREWLGKMLATDDADIENVGAVNAMHGEVKRLLALTLQAADRYAEARERFGMVMKGGQPADYIVASTMMMKARAQLVTLLGVEDNVDD